MLRRKIESISILSLENDITKWFYKAVCKDCTVKNVENKCYRSMLVKYCIYMDFVIF